MYDEDVKNAVRLGNSGIAENTSTVATLGGGTASFSFCSAARPSDLGRRKGSVLTVL